MNPSTLGLLCLLTACATTPAMPSVSLDPALDEDLVPRDLTVYFQGGLNHRDVLLATPATLRAQGYARVGFQRRPVMSRYEIAVGTRQIRFQALAYPEARPLCRHQLEHIEAVCDMAPLLIFEVRAADGTCSFEIPLGPCYQPRRHP